jgi:hypothetical protein
MDKRNVAIVSTSINAAPMAYKAWAEMGTLIVAGDHKTPNSLHDYVVGLGGLYLGVDKQSNCPGSNFIGWNCIQRRNAAIWEALIMGFDVIATVDDDNAPTSAFFMTDHVKQLGNRPATTMGARSGFVNLGELCIPAFHQRGTPYGVDTKPYVERAYPGNGPEVVVCQAMVTGDPDCDAIDRMANSPTVAAVATDAVITPGAYAAFNSQATVWRRDWAPVMAVMPGVGRYDDIFASFIFARLAKTYNVALYAGTPVVHQNRNDHDLVKDLRAELFGMNIVYEFCAALSHAHISADMPIYESYSELITAVAHLLPSDAIKFAQAWGRAWRDNL